MVLSEAATQQLQDATEETTMDNSKTTQNNETPGGGSANPKMDNLLARGAEMKEAELEAEEQNANQPEIAPLFTTPNSRAATRSAAPTVLITIADADQLELLDGALPATITPAAIPSAGAWKTCGKARTGFDELITEGTTTIIIALGDYTTDAEAHAEALGLSKHLSMFGTEIKFIDTQDLATVIEHLAPARRTNSIATLIAQAVVALPTRAPKGSLAATRAVLGQDIDWSEAQIKTRGQSPKVLCEAAMRVLRTYRVIDSFSAAEDKYTEKITHDVEVAFRDQSGHVRVYEVTNVPDKHLSTPREILNRAPGGSAVPFDHSPGSISMVENAVRTEQSNLIRHITVDSHSGWVEVDGVVGYMHGGGLLTATGNKTFLRAELHEDYAGINLRDPAKITLLAEWEAASAVVTGAGEFADRLFWAGVVGPIMRALAGHSPAEVVPYVNGIKGSGKTTALRGPGSLMCEQWGTGEGGDLPHIFDDSSAIARGFGRSLHDGFIIIDNGRTKTSGAETRDQEKAMETLLRAGYAGGAGRRRVKVQTSTGWKNEAKDLSSPVIVFSAEKLMIPDQSASSLERLLVIPFTKTTFKGGVGKYKEAFAGTRPQEHTASYLAWVARKIESQTGGLKGWKQSGREMWEKAKSEVPTGLGLTDRTIGTIASVTVGLQLWKSYLLDLSERITAARVELPTLDVIDPLPSPEAIQTFIAEHIAAGIIGGINHSKNIMREGELQSYTALLHKLTSAVAGLRVHLDAKIGKYTHIINGGGNIRLGKIIEGRGENAGKLMVAINPGEALKVIRAAGPNEHIQERDLFDAFEPVRITDGGGKRFKMVDLGHGNRVACLVIPAEIWVGSQEGVKAMRDEVAAVTGKLEAEEKAPAEEAS